MAMQHSRSRLAHKATLPLPIEASPNNQHHFGPQPSLHHRLASVSLPVIPQLSPAIKNYLARWPQLAIGLSVLAALIKLISSYYPVQLADFLLPNTYLSVLGLWFIGSWYCGSFLLHNTKKSLGVALITTLWLFSRLQQLITPTWLWILLLLGWLTLGFLFDIFRRYRQNRRV